MIEPNDSSRLRALQDTELLDSPEERAFDRLTRLASGLLGAPASLVSLVDQHRQFFKSAFGLKDPWASKRETPLSHSFCQYVTQDRKALVISDARDDDRLRDNGAIQDLNVIAYAGIPLIINGEAIGSFCVIDDKPRVWTPDELKLLEDLAASVVSEIELRMALRSGMQQRALKDAMIESIADGLLALDQRGNVLLSNAKARALFGDDIAVGAWLTITGPNPSRRYLQHDESPLPPEDAPLARALRGESTDGLELMVVRDDITDRTWVDVTARPVLGPDGRILAAIAAYRDVTEKRKNDAALRRSEELYRAIVQNIPNGAVMMVDRSLRYVAADGPLIGAVLQNARLSSIVGKLVTDVSSEKNRDHLLDIYKSALRGNRHHLEVQRGERFYDLSVIPMSDAEDGKPTHALVFLHDVTERKAELVELEQSRVILEQQARELKEASVTDELTGLLNRRGFVLIAEQEMRVAARNAQKLILFFVDLNGMKTINDTLGHKMGDRALIESAAILRKVFRSSDVVARLGGDEFVVLATDAAVATSGPAVMARLQGAIREYNGKSPPFLLSMSVGSSIYDPTTPATLEALLSEADAGMYAAKQEQKRSAGNPDAQTTTGPERPSRIPDRTKIS